jgi:hypothetical protein
VSKGRYRGYAIFPPSCGKKQLPVLRIGDYGSLYARRSQYVACGYRVTYR